jgi:hypothetical protein
LYGRVIRKKPDVSVEHVAYTFRVEKQLRNVATQTAAVSTVAAV